MYALNLEQVVECYLEHKISLGLHFRQESWLLRHIQKQIVEDGRGDLDAIAYERWNNSIRDRHANTRRKWQQIVYNFCLYRRRSDPAAFVPEAEGFARRRPYVAPVIVEPEQISRMLIVAAGFASTGSSPLRGPCMRLAVVLLYACGLRLGELLRLRLSDVEDSGRVLRIRESKFGRSRLIPLSESAAAELRAYLDRRRALASAKADTSLLCNCCRGALHPYSHTSRDRLLTDADDMADSIAWKEIEAEREKWARMLPERTAELLPWLLVQDVDITSNLFAFCVAATLDGTSAVDHAHPINELADLLHVDLSYYWKPTRASYFDHVSKARMVDVVAAAVSPEAAMNLQGMKKGDAAAAAELRMADSGWLPEVLTNRETPERRSYGYINADDDAEDADEGEGDDDGNEAAAAKEESQDT